MSLNGLVECTNCRVWSDVPEGFKETKHFAKCPLCNKAMYLSRNTKPSDIGLKQERKVIATLMLHGEEL